MLKMVEKCPVCGGPVVITEVRCARGHVKMQGEFEPGPFSTLSEEQLTFVRSFLRVRGNLSEMEKVLGVSYPTIRNKLDEINKALDEAPAPGEGESAPAGGSARTAILAQVAAGQLDAAAALEQLRALGEE